MNSFEDILVILFILFGIFSSLFGNKKKKTDAKKSAELKKKNLVPFEDPLQESQSYEPEVETASQDSFFNSLKAFVNEATTRDYSERKIAQLNKEYIEPETKKTTPLQQTIKLESPTLKKIENQRASYFKDKISNPETLREYFIFSEILQKPLALRNKYGKKI